MYKSYFKVLFDLIVSSFILVIAFPIFGIITLLLLIANQGKPFFFQLRPGKNEKIFKIIRKWA